MEKTTQNRCDRDDLPQIRTRAAHRRPILGRLRMEQQTPLPANGSRLAPRRTGQ